MARTDERPTGRTTTRQVGGGARAKSAGRITWRDAEIAAWVGRVPLAEARQVAERFSMGRSQAYRRLQVLTERGELRCVRMLHGAPAAYVARGRKVPLATYDHALCLAALACERELALGVDALGRSPADEQLTFTERELRAARRRGDELPIDLGDSLLPDLAEAIAAGPRAYEIELTPKAAERWRAVLSAYALADPPYERVTYIVRTPQIGTAVTRAAEAIGARALVGLRELPAEWVRAGPLDRR